MAQQIFISYSTGDQPVADAICKALESSGIKCWIAPRDIETASGWGGSIVAGIRGSQAVLVVFSERSNASPQVVREMELAVSQRLPLIPVRIADALPTEDMQYFLGVSHWFNAYPQSVATYLPEIVAMSHRVLAKEGAPWRRFTRRLPQSRFTQYGILGAAAFLAAVVTAWLMRPAPAPDLREGFRSPIAGRWQAELADAQGQKQPCLLDAPDFTPASFSTTCPLPLSGSSVGIQFAKDGSLAPQLYTAGKDTGTFQMSGGNIVGLAGSYRRDGRNRLITRDSQRGEIQWTRVKAEGPLPDDMDGILPKQASWPVKDVAAIAARALAYAKGKWAPDAVLMAVEAEFEGTNSYRGNLETQAGTVALGFELYSASRQAQTKFSPESRYMTWQDMGTRERDLRRALPESFVDLPDAIAVLQARGLRGKQINVARLENWPPNAVYHGVRVSGVAWVIETALGEQSGVAALK